MPQLPQVPRWKTLIQYFKSPYVPLQELNEFMRKQGSTIQLFSGGRHPMIVTADPEFAQHILLKNRDNYQKTSKSFATIRHFYGNGLLNSEGSYWKKQRKMIQKGFHRARLKKVFGFMEKVTEEYLQEVDQQLWINPQIDICEMMLELTFRVIANAIFSANLQKKESTQGIYISS